jgi:hypothetical protein
VEKYLRALLMDVAWYFSANSISFVKALTESSNTIAPPTPGAAPMVAFLSIFNAFFASAIAEGISSSHDTSL